MSVYEKLLAVQTELKAPKNQDNLFGGFRYRSCEGILEAVKPLLRKVNAVLVISDDIIAAGNRFYVKATAAFQDVESGEGVEAFGYAREPDSRPKMDEAQVTGSSSSYARKYALNGLFCIDDTKDPDAANAGQGGKAPKGQGRAEAGQEKITAAQLATLRHEADRKGVGSSTICQRYGKKELGDLTVLDFKKAMSGLSKMPDKTLRILTPDMGSMGYLKMCRSGRKERRINGK